jgi:hypothetical protein
MKLIRCKYQTSRKSRVDHPTHDPVIQRPILLCHTIRLWESTSCQRTLVDKRSIESRPRCNVVSSVNGG